jgi:hypothetical protein
MGAYVRMHAHHVAKLVCYAQDFVAAKLWLVSSQHRFEGELLDGRGIHHAMVNRPCLVCLLGSLG